MADRQIVIVVGSPHAGGACEKMARHLEEEAVKQGAEVKTLRICDLSIGGCTGCDACRESPHACIIDDDMRIVDDALAKATSLIVVSPVYFAGPPSQLKALLDRLQPHYWKLTRKRQSSRSATLHIVGEGGDPYGFEPLETTIRSSLAVAGFHVERVHAHIGHSPQKGEEH